MDLVYDTVAGHEGWVSIQTIARASQLDEMTVVSAVYAWAELEVMTMSRDGTKVKTAPGMRL